jgi:hypothetical protein
MSGFHLACLVAAAICLVGATGALALPGRARRSATVSELPQSESANA